MKNMNHETRSTTAFEVGKYAIRKRDGKVCRILGLDRDGWYEVAFVDADDPDTTLTYAEIVPVSDAGITESFEFAAKLQEQLQEWRNTPKPNPTQEEIEAEARRIAENIDKAADGEARHKLATHLVKVNQASEEGLWLLEHTKSSTQEITERVRRVAPQLFGKVTEKVPSSNTAIETSETASIPPFDDCWITGIFREFVDVVTGGTTLPRQYAYAISKVVIGAMMAGKMRFEDLDCEPRLYVPLIRETGSGKGETWRRALKALRPEGSLIRQRIKIINSADSGAGLKDYFFEPPEHLPVLCFVDEVTSLGNKAAPTRNPGILDCMIELADSTSISRVLAKRDGVGTKTKDDARFSMVLCAQDGMTLASAFAGRAKLGLWDRLYPEFATPTEPGELPPVDTLAAIQLLTKLDSMDLSGSMSLSPEAKTRLDEFWASQASEIRKKARWRKHLLVDAFMCSFGRGLRSVELSDAETAIQMFIRQTKIREVCFGTEVPDRVGHYLALIKKIVERMLEQMRTGVAPDLVALSRRDFEKKTNASRLNEEVLFARAWDVYAKNNLVAVSVPKSNGRSYIKYLPLVEE
jgi:hypothetical protein